MNLFILDKMIYESTQPLTYRQGHWNSKMCVCSVSSPNLLFHGQSKKLCVVFAICQIIVSAESG